MSGETDELKGRAREAGGVVTGDCKFRREGEIDQAAGKAKQAVEEIVDKSRDAAQWINQQ